jgi:uncharacterized repeat protein (TIGR02543 family)/LPXTG-motif cell wall-anchored protein/prepilin-type processing-associated H-X9-DG protein
VAGIEANEYKIVFNANGGTGAMDDQAMTYDVRANLSANAFTRTGYTFSGWNTAADGSGTSYVDGNSVVNLTTVHNGTVTLYAQWTPNADTKYTVEFYYENNLAYGEPVSTETRTGTTGAAAVLSEQDLTPDASRNTENMTYALDRRASQTSGTIAADGSLALKVCFRQQFSVSIERNEERAYNGAEQTVTLGDDMTVTLDGSVYTVSGVTLTATAKDVDGNDDGKADVTPWTVKDAEMKVYDGQRDVTDRFTVNFTGGLTITPASAKIAAISASKMYGAQDPAFTAKVTGVFEGDSLSYAVTRETGETVRTYRMSVENASAPHGNYTIETADAQFEITAANTLVVTPTDYLGVYDGNSHTGAASANAEGSTILWSVDGGRTWTEEAPSVKNVTERTVLVKATNPNYSDSEAKECTLTVTPAPLTLATENRTKTYDGTPFAGLNAVSVSLPDGTDATLVYLNADAVDVGVYSGSFNILFADGSSKTFRPEGDNAESVVARALHLLQLFAADDAEENAKLIDNYDISVSGFGTLTITPAALTVTTESATRVYNGEALTADGAVSGLVNGETVTFAVTGSQTEVGSSENGYELSWNGTAKESNYTVVENLGTLTVTESAPPAPVIPDVDVDIPTPGPAPTPTPTPTPTPDEPTTIPEEDVPLTDAPETTIPDADVPLTDAPETTIPDADVPLADAPETMIPDEDVPLAEAPVDVLDIEDEDVPLADATPQTADTSLTVFWMGLSAMSLGGVLVLLRKREEEEA